MLVTNELFINFDSQALHNIYSAGQTVTVVSGVSSYVANQLVASAASPQPVWFVFRPLQNNHVTWTNALSLYATVTPPYPPNVIMVNSKTAQPATLGHIYKFAQGHFASDSGSKTNYNVRNEMGEYSLYFGLLQEAQVNGASISGPLNAVPVLRGQEANMTLLNRISIFLSTASADGTVIPGVPASALTFEVTGHRVNIAFNDATNTFYIVDNAVAAVNQ